MLLGMLSSKTRRAVQNLPPVKEHLLITRYAPKRVNSGDMLSAQDVQEILAIPLIALTITISSVLKKDIIVTHVIEIIVQFMFHQNIEGLP